MYAIADFTNELTKTARQWTRHNYPTIGAELTAISTALGTDPTIHDKTIEAHPAAVRIGPAQTPFTNDILILVNKGKGGNVTPAAMAAAITGLVLAPVSTAAPVASGTGTVGQVLTSTAGTFSNSPTAYAYQWQRNGAKITGAVAATHTLVAADSGKSIACMVTAINAMGSASAASNAIACA